MESDDLLRVFADWLVNRAIQHDVSNQDKPWIFTRELELSSDNTFVHKGEYLTSEQLVEEFNKLKEHEVKRFTHIG